jgi:hypothetical protein
VTRGTGVYVRAGGVYRGVTGMGFDRSCGVFRAAGGAALGAGVFGAGVDLSSEGVLARGSEGIVCRGL